MKNKIIEWIFEVAIPAVIATLLVMSIIATTHLDNTYSKMLQKIEENTAAFKESTAAYEENIAAYEKNIAAYEEMIQLLRQD